MPAFQPILPNTERNKEVTEGLTGFLPPGMDMVLESLLSAFLPTTDEDAMQQMSDSVLADLALGIITPSQGRTARQFIEDTLEQMTPGVRRAQAVPNAHSLSVELLRKNDLRPAHARFNEFVVPHNLAISPDLFGSKGTLASMSGVALPGQGRVRPFSGLNPRFTGKATPGKTQMVLEDLFFKRNPTKGVQSQNEVLTHELGHLVDQAVGRDVVEELTSKPHLVSLFRDAIRRGGQPHIATRLNNKLFENLANPSRELDKLFSEGVASLLQLGEKLPRALTNKIPELAGLESFIDSIVFGGGR